MKTARILSLLRRKMNMENFMQTLGPRLVDNGLSIVPIAPSKKFPATFEHGQWRPMYGWTRYADRAPTDLELFHWTQWPGAGVGIICAALAAVDIDFLDAEKAYDIDQLARHMLGDTPALRIGRTPKRLLVYRSDPPLQSVSLGKIELLGLGRQFVGYGIHPATGFPYFWPDESLADIRTSDIPLLSELRLREFLELVQTRFPDDVVSRDYPRIDGSGVLRKKCDWQSSETLRGNVTAVGAAMAFIPNNDLPYDHWVRIGMALKGALGDEGWPLFAAWSGQSLKNDPSITERTWRSFTPKFIGAGTIYYLARQAGWSPGPEVRFKDASDEKHPARKYFRKF